MYLIDSQCHEQVRKVWERKVFQITACTQLKPQGQQHHHSLICFFVFKLNILCSWLWWWDLPQHWTQPFSGHIRSRRREMSLSACPLPGEPFLGRETRLWSQSRSGILYVGPILPLYIKGLQICIYADNHVCVGLFINPGCVFWLVWSKASKM